MRALEPGILRPVNVNDYKWLYCAATWTAAMTAPRRTDVPVIFSDCET